MAEERHLVGLPRHRATRPAWRAPRGAAATLTCRQLQKGINQMPWKRHLNENEKFVLRTRETEAQ